MGNYDPDEPAYITTNYIKGVSRVRYKTTVADAIKFCSLPETSNMNLGAASYFYGWLPARNAGVMKRGSFKGGDNRFDALAKEHGIKLEPLDDELKTRGRR